MSVIIGKTASRIAQQIRQVVSKANAEFNKEGPPNKKVIQELRKDWKKLNDALPATEQDEKITPAKDKKPVMERGDVPSLSIGAGEDAYSKGTTPFRPKDEPPSKAVSEGRDTGRKGFAQKKQELTIKGDRSVPFKSNVRNKLKRIQAQANTEFNKEGPPDLKKIEKLRKEYKELKNKYFTKSDKTIEAFKGNVKKIPEGKAGSFKQPKKTTPVDKQKKQITSKAKRKLDEGPPDPRGLQYLARQRKQYEELSKASDEVVKLLADPNFEKQQRTETQLKKLVGRYTPAQLRELMGASGTDAKTISRDTGIKARSPKSIDPEEYIASRRGNPLQALIKKKAKPQRYRQIIKNLQNASPKIQRLAVRLGIIGKAAIKESNKKTPTKPTGGRTTTTKKQIFKSKPTRKQYANINQATDEGEMAYQRAVNRKKVDIKSLTPTERKAFIKSITKRKKGGKVLKTKVKRKTNQPRKRKALRGYGAALRGF